MLPEMGVILVAFIVLPMLEWLEACAVTLGVAADVVVTLVSVVPVVLGASLVVCGVAATAAVTLELTVMVSSIGVFSLLDKLVTVVETLREAIVAEVIVVR